MKQKKIIFLLLSVVTIFIIGSFLNFKSSEITSISSNNSSFIINPTNSNGSPIPIENYTIHTNISEGEKKEFNITTSNSIIINIAFLIFKDKIFQQITNITLDKKPLDNIFYKDIEFQNLTVGNYSVWYGLQDNLGNSNVTLTFNLEINSSKYPYPFKLISTAQNPDENGSFLLAWKESKNAHNFTIYHSNQYINFTDMKNPTILKKGFIGFSYFCEAYPNGKHFFMIISFSLYGNISSNCIEVNILRDDVDVDLDDIDDETHNLGWVWAFVIVAGIIIGGIAVIYYVRRYLRKREVGFSGKIKFLKTNIE